MPRGWQRPKPAVEPPNRRRGLNFPLEHCRRDCYESVGIVKSSYLRSSVYLGAAAVIQR